MELCLYITSWNEPCDFIWSQLQSCVKLGRCDKWAQVAKVILKNTKIEVGFDSKMKIFYVFDLLNATYPQEDALFFQISTKIMDIRD